MECGPTKNGQCVSSSTEMYPVFKQTSYTQLRDRGLTTVQQVFNYSMS